MESSPPVLTPFDRSGGNEEAFEPMESEPEPAPSTSAPAILQQVKSQRGRIQKARQSYGDTAWEEAFDELEEEMEIKVPPMKRRKRKGKKKKQKQWTWRLSDTKPGKPRKKSIVWHFFTRVPPDHLGSSAECRLCNRRFRNPGGSTTGMRGHLTRDHPGMMEQAQEDDKRMALALAIPAAPIPGPSTGRRGKPKTKRSPRKPKHSPVPATPRVKRVVKAETVQQGNNTRMIMNQFVENPSTPVIESQFSQGQNNGYEVALPQEDFEMDTDTVSRSIVQYLVSKMLPISSANDSAFKSMLSSVNQHSNFCASFFSSDILHPVTDTLDKMYFEVRQSISEQLFNKHVSLNLELWAKSHFDIYLVVAANYISDKWRLATDFLGVRQLPGASLNTSVDTLQAKISSVLATFLEDFQIRHENISVIILNSGKFPFPFQTLHLKIRDVHIPTWACLNDALLKSYHLVNDSVREITGEDILIHSKRIVKPVYPNFKELKMHPGHLIDAMSKVISHKETEDDDIEVVEDQLLEDIQVYKELQQPINNLVDGLMEESHLVLPASNILPLLLGTRDLFEFTEKADNGRWARNEKQKQISNKVIDLMQGCFKANINSEDLRDPTLGVCTLLDPRFKKLEFLSDEQKQAVNDKVMEKLYHTEQEIRHGPITNVRSNYPSTSRASDMASTPIVLELQSNPNRNRLAGGSRLSQFISKVVGKKDIPNPSNDVRDELTKYLRETLVGNYTVNPYQWWRSNSHRFPTVAALAKKYLCVPAIVNPANLIFTTEGKLRFAKMAQVEPEYLDKMMCVKRFNASKEQEEEEDNQEGEVLEIDMRRVKQEMIEEIVLD